jgi:hypothetical protein
MTCNKLKLQVGSSKEQHNLKDSTDFDSFVLEQFRSSDTLNISNVKRKGVWQDTNNYQKRCRKNNNNGNKNVYSKNWP